MGRELRPRLWLGLQRLVEIGPLLGPRDLLHLEATIKRQADRKLKEAAEEERVRKAAEDAIVAAAREAKRIRVWGASAEARAAEEEFDRLARAQAAELVRAHCIP